MTVSSILPVNNYIGNSSNKKFDFDFLIESETELVVNHIDSNGILTTLKNGIDYSINEIGNSEGSYITFPLDGSSYEVLNKDEKLSLSLHLVIKQENEFKNSSYFNFKVLEWTFDYIVRILQILSRKVDRSIKVEETSDSTPDELLNSINKSQIQSKNSADSASISAAQASSSAIATRTYAEEANNIYSNFISTINESKNSIINDIKSLGCYMQGDILYYKDENGNVHQFMNPSRHFCDIVWKDNLLNIKNSQGYALLGTYVYKTPIQGTRYGYPEFYNKLIAEYQDPDNTTETLTVGSDTVTITVNSNGHKFYNIEDKSVIDELYSEKGLAWYYGIDEANERIFLPRALTSLYLIGKINDVGVVGTGIALGITNGTTYGGLHAYGPSYYLNALGGDTYDYGKNVGSHNGDGAPFAGGDALGITTEAEKSGLKSLTSDLVNSEVGYLYMVVGETSEVQSVSVELTSKTADAPLGFDTDTGALILNKNDEFTTDTDGNLAINASSFTSENKDYISGLGIPSNRFIDLSLGASGNSYTAPANGYFYLDKLVGGDWYYTEINVFDSNNIYKYALFESEYRTSPSTILAPVLKNDKVTIKYNATGTTNLFRFIYAEGAE